ncbi:hypothetical protein FRB90_000399 [Tulasnella sp. 427]|nr:hypothetical protein FRB90_000399 [Tulasnella sp. 427]
MEGEDVVFYGKNGEECEGFIRAVRKAGFNAKKIRDDAWMADFASTCLAGGALRWFENQPPNVQGDWRLLRQALLKQYPPANVDQDTTERRSSSSYGYPTEPTPAPAAAPPPAPAAAPPPRFNSPQKQRGRIRVTGTNGHDYGYLTEGKTATTSNLGAMANPPGQMQFSFTPGAEGALFEIEIENTQSPQSRRVLGTHWANPLKATLSDTDYAAVTALNCSGSSKLSDMTWSGTKESSVWSISPTGALVPHLENGTVVHTMLYDEKSSSRPYSIDLVLDAAKFCQKHSTTYWTPANLSFEPFCGKSDLGDKKTA